MNKDLAAQFLSAIITRNSGQRIEDDVKEALAYAEAFEKLTKTEGRIKFEDGHFIADYTTPQAVQYAVSGSDFSIKADNKSCEWEDGFTDDFTRYGFAEGKLESPIIQALRRINELEERITFIHNALQQSAKDGYIIKNPPIKEGKWTLRFNGTDGEFYTKKYRNELLECLLDSYDKSKKITFLVAADNGTIAHWKDKKKILSFYSDAKHINVIPCFSEKEIKEQIDAYYEERGGFAKHVEYLKSIGQW